MTEKEEVTKTPFLNARVKLNDRNSEVLSIGKLGIIIGLMGMLIGLAAVGGTIYIGSQSRFIPLVFQQDKGGNTISIVSAERVPPATQIDYTKAAARFVENMRTVTTDTGLQRKFVLQTYSFLASNDPALEKANEYLNGAKEKNPFHRAAYETVGVEIVSVLPQSEQSWQVDWVETVRVKNGQLKEKPHNMRAILQLYQGEPSAATTESDALRNEHFIYVRDFNWSKQL
jgi:type IV secretion system protein TrbF